MPPFPPLDPDSIDIPTFLDVYWQKHPCRIRGWLDQPPLPISADRLKTLAGREHLASRLITGARESGNWTLDYGPFSPGEISAMPARNSTFLVQDVDKVDREVASLLDHFSFIPDLMLDDIMVSQATPGGSVGPHTDAYDVFLVQVEGTRRGELARQFDPTLDPEFELALLKNFDPEVRLDVRPGEVLYLPPGVAHHGAALDKCQTWSVGIRAPSGLELLESLVDWQLEVQGQAPSSPTRRLQARAVDPAQPHRLDPALADQALALMEELLPTGRESVNRFAGQALTGYRSFEPDPPPEPADLTAPLILARHIRRAWVAEGQGERLFVQGRSMACPAGVGQRICQPGPFHVGDLETLAGKDFAHSLVAWLDDLEALVNPAPSGNKQSAG